ncbi:acetylxylan esterase [Actinomadura barringtoniae]|uniref:Acetylxylan esterase n=1 Tax=Actinomadura barringtoniae TaxID=1427535 RepID=A0A939PM15_9ACTN|nr:CocE/NonD family hydrolase [Actinomadura barringtoniae]MBO2454832.1 acetylxylan esterase [Actinomadura barringtoniae]
MRRLLVGAVTAGVTALSITTLPVTSATAAHAEDKGATVSYESIPGDGGAALKALVVRPTGYGTGRSPLLVMPASWSMPHAEYVLAATKLAKESGYTVVSYTSRGFWDSAGTIEVAGREDISDVSRVIDWAVKNAGADETRVGAAGISYGAGISLLAAAFDKRIKAVSAMSGWADLKASLYPNETVNEQAAATLLLAGNVTGRPGKDLKRLQDAYLADKLGPVLPLATNRGAATFVPQINANRPAVMIANQWGDGIFPPSQIAAFYNRLDVPKRLMLQPGDHATGEALGAAGLPNDVWAATGRWFDHYLKGADNGIDRETPVNLKPNNGGGWKGYASWRAVSRAAASYRLDGTRRLAAGKATVADSGIIFASGVAQQAGIQWKINVRQVDPKAGAVWQTAPYARATTVGGSPSLHTTVTPSAANSSVFAYLYDVAPNGEGQLISHKPYTLRDAAPGKPRAINVSFEPVSWTVPAGHHLALVVDTTDVRYRTMSKSGTVTLTSPAKDPSRLTVPTS